MAISDEAGGAGGHDPGALDAVVQPLAALYQDLILAHHRSPQHRGTLEAPTTQAHIANPTCGDAVTVALRMRDGVIEAVRFEGEGCAISLASASMMASLVEGMRFEEARTLAIRFASLMRGEDEVHESDWEPLGDLRALASVARFPARLRCALLPFEALEAALEQAG